MTRTHDLLITKIGTGARQALFAPFRSVFGCFLSCPPSPPADFLLWVRLWVKCKIATHFLASSTKTNAAAIHEPLPELEGTPHGGGRNKKKLKYTDKPMPRISLDALVFPDAVSPNYIPNCLYEFFNDKTEAEAQKYISLCQQAAAFKDDALEKKRRYPLIWQKTQGK